MFYVVYAANVRRAASVLSWNKLAVLLFKLRHVYVRPECSVYQAMVSDCQFGPIIKTIDL